MSTAPHYDDNHADDGCSAQQGKQPAPRAVAYDRDHPIARSIARRPGHRLLTAAETPEAPRTVRSQCSGQDFLDFRTGEALTSANACASHRPSSARPGTSAPRRGVSWCLA